MLHKTAKRSLFALINNNSNVKQKKFFFKLSVTILTTGGGGGGGNEKIIIKNKRAQNASVTVSTEYSIKCKKQQLKTKKGSKEVQ